MKRFCFTFLTFTLLIVFSFSLRGSAQQETPSVELNVNPSQNVIVKPKTGNAEGSLNFHLAPKGKATSADREPIDVVFIFDKSGSMNELGKNPKKFQSAKDAMTEATNFFKENAGPNDRFAFIPFSSDVETDKIVYFSPNNGKESLDLIYRTANSLSASGGTNYTQSFEKALEMLEGGNNNKYIIFMTDGEPTFSNVKEKITYKKRVQVGTEKKCFFFVCWDEPVYDYKTVTEDIVVHYELYGQGSKMYSKVYYYLNGEQHFKNINVKDTIAAIRQHGISMSEKLAEKNIKLYSIGFGNDSEVDMDYLRKLSAITGVTARQASQENIAPIFEEISKDIDTPSISGEIKVDLSRFNGKVKVMEGSDARVDENNIAIFNFNFSYPINQNPPQPIDLTLPLSFSETGTYTFNNIEMTYNDLSGKKVSVTYSPVTIEVKDDAPPSFKGTMTLKGVENTPDNLIKISNSTERTNEFTVQYDLEPYGLVDNRVSGSITNIKIIQPLPEGISAVSTAGVSIENVSGTPAAVIMVPSSINYTNGVFNPNKLTAAITLKADWALSNVKMPLATVQYKDSRFGHQETTIPASNQVINSKVRLREFPNNAYDGDSSGIITKLNLDENGKKLAQTEYPNNYGLKNKAIKEMVFQDGSANTTIKITYYDNDIAFAYLKPDYELRGNKTGRLYKNGDSANEPIDIKLSNLVAGKGVKYSHLIENGDEKGTWVEFSPDDTITITKPGVNKIKVKAEGGFAIKDLIVEKVITIENRIESITIEPDPIEIDVGSTASFTVKIQPEEATNKTLDFEIRDRTVADFTDTNRILGKTEGETVLVVRTKDGSNIVKTVPIIVKDPYIPLEELKFKKSVFKLGLGEKIPLTDLLIFNPDNATQKKIDHVVSEMDHKVQVVNENGIWYLIGKEVGYSTVTVTAEEQRNGNQPHASALFEVITASTDDEDDGSPDAGRW
ncbi:hypothetical protein C0966_10500 [Bacillus methanolicus]|uniref:VWA domain-containing protein n=1 Tax=Bacillus methanolicus TaxID=1471 RepID=UPI0023803436|nr:VWA domain-containing protein [Bacillus methanolicus]MDE3839788.1 hypothetical protein [Bacillus methanolicus]